MPLGEADVLNTLSDPVTLNLDFHVDKAHISGKFYTTIRDHIRAGNILVVGGTESLAYYNKLTDVLTTQTGTPPANLDQRAQILHECTHALIDVFNHENKLTRHLNEIASYIAQVAYSVRSAPSAVSVSDGSLWGDFWAALYSFVRTSGIDKPAGNGARISASALEPLRLQLVGLPGVGYGRIKKEAPDLANGLSRNHLFVTDQPADLRMRSSTVAMLPYPDPGDHYLVQTFLENYSAGDVAGQARRLRQLRLDFTKCSLNRALVLKGRLGLRRKGDRVSELFFDRMSSGSRAILLRVLNDRR